jgi:hypothetical protein
MVLPTLNGVDPQQREVFVDLHEQGYDVEDLMEVEGEEEEVQEAPTLSVQLSGLKRKRSRSCVMRVK